LAYGALFLAVFEACSDDEASAPLPPAGPASVEITGIALGQGFVGDGGASSVLACDYTIGVNVQLTNWDLLGPGRCGGALQCGQLRVSLLDVSDVLPGVELPTVISAGNGVSLNVGALLSATPPLQSGTYAVQVELVDDAGKAYVGVDGGNGSVQQQFYMALPMPSECTAGNGGASAGNGGASAGNDGASAGNGGASAGNGGASAGTAGTAGSAAAGTGGVTEP
jgi:hypothetical protein